MKRFQPLVEHFQQRAGRSRPRSCSNSLLRKECSRIVAACGSYPLHPGQLVQERENYRRRKPLPWIAPEWTTTRWIYERIATMIAKAERLVSLRAVRLPRGRCIFIRYGRGRQVRLAPGLRRGPHLHAQAERHDPAHIRRTTMKEAGLEFCPQGELHRSRLPRRGRTVFPSMLAHRVTPIERGVRHSIVAWDPRAFVPLTLQSPPSRVGTFFPARTYSVSMMKTLRNPQMIHSPVEAALHPRGFEMASRRDARGLERRAVASLRRAFASVPRSARTARAAYGDRFRRPRLTTATNVRAAAQTHARSPRRASRRELRAAPLGAAGERGPTARRDRRAGRRCDGGRGEP